jgi:hypothetical protein
MLNRILFRSLILLMAATTAKSQGDWPRTITGADGEKIQVSHPQPDSFIDNSLYFHATFSFTKKGGTPPVNGSFHAHAVIETDKNNRTLRLRTATIISTPSPTNTTYSSPAAGSSQKP